MYQCLLVFSISFVPVISGGCDFQLTCPATDCRVEKAIAVVGFQMGKDMSDMGAVELAKMIKPRGIYQ